MDGPRIHITGASGAGVSTLGHALAGVLDAPWFDVDDYYWLKTDPPFQRKRPVAERVSRLAGDLTAERWVLSGSIGTWGEDLIGAASLVVYLDAPSEIRLARLRTREHERFGDRIAPGGDMHAHHLAFLDWAAAYDRGDRDGRTRSKHETCLSRLAVPVLRLDGAQPSEALVQQTLGALTA